MRILDLKEEPQHIPTLAQWHHQQWSYLNPGGSIEARIEKMQTYLGDALIPSTFIAIDGIAKDGELLGSAAIIAQDMDTRLELTPWLASVFVAPEHRHKQIGRTLVQHIMQKARAANIKTLYLFTPDRAHFYREMGWSALSVEEYRGQMVTVMCVNLCD